MSPKVPESSEVVIRTPASTPLQSGWPASPPCFQSQQSLTLSPTFLQPSIAADHEMPIESVTGEATILCALPNCFSYSAADDLSWLTANFDLPMPEVWEDENRAEKEPPLERFKLVFFQISNKLYHWNIALDEWDSIVALLEDFGIMKMPLQLQRMDTTLQSVAEILFQQSFTKLKGEYHRDCKKKGFIIESSSYPESREGECWDGDWDGGVTVKLPSWRIIDWLLSSGQNPNAPIRHENEGRLTPLQTAVDLGCSHLIRLLLDAKSNPNMVYDAPDLPIRRLLLPRYPTTTCKRKIRLLKLFLENNACAGSVRDGQADPLLRTALEGLQHNFDISGLELLDMLIDKQAQDWWKRRFDSPLEWATKTCSILGYAAGLRDETVAMSCVSHFLKRAQQSDQSLLPVHVITPDAIFLAASSGHNRVLGLLRGFGIDLTLCGHRGISALHVVAYCGHLEACHALLRLGIPVDGFLDARHLPSPLHFAACCGNLGIIQLLHSYGADFTRDIRLEDRWHWIKFIRCMMDERAATPVGAVILSRNYRVWEFLAQQGVRYPPWAAYYEASQYDRRPKAVRLALEMGADPNWRGQSGFPALQYALKNPEVGRNVADTVEVAIALLDAGADLTGGEIANAILLNDWHLINRLLDVDSFGIGQRHDLKSIFKAAISNGSQHLIKRLLEKYQPGTIHRHELMSMLEAAIADGSHDLIHQLLETVDLGIGHRHEVRSILVAAITNGSLELTTQILSQCPDAYDTWVLCVAVFFEDHGVGIVQNLLSRRPKQQDVLALESLAIGIAAWREREDLLGVLLNEFPSPSPAALPKDMIDELKGLERDEKVFDKVFTNVLKFHRSNKSVFWRDKHMISCSPLTLALTSEISLSRLLNHGFLPDRLTMFIAAALGRSGAIRQLSCYPMTSGDFEDYAGPLAMVVRRNDIGAVKSLLGGVHCIDEDNSMVTGGRSPLQMAVECGHFNLIKFLLNAGADVNNPAARRRGATALQLAAIKGYLGVAKLLVDLGADINAPGAQKHGRTALEGAAEYGRIGTIQYFLSRGVRTEARGRISYLRAVRYAVLEGHQVAAKLLRAWCEWDEFDEAFWDRIRFFSSEECENLREKDTCDWVISYFFS
ncbi:unnamed protein product [Colletotrichum noveboracense]|uniref:Ankyrin repeat protein n=1 Tax=Colletotrichum noveboracense TaxID=2664923 RepID=A0A9W4RU41_9PEZI|nr:unnamed protein product [Colletotrichum noveboracense]